ncbi:NAD(P)/FAD-dependent oxidoreductase [Pseudoalteromonas sp. G4]|uniref:NAD(P)/FAD-dependent oxidoreductase n=1 Tax=Pseudoalteromonas sp. G4 TaxID=2992761 RepID=UPI00237E3F46|nr:NAD(P)/FAD-dependent oxidoreductase [Pseudoalteromonas sp. G4]MDE3271998.1 tryptophan 7-halogenase [Pseudoalteromonas sp. G4]
MKVEKVDVVVIGAGPSGAVASSLLNKQGKQVIVLERETFPRFSIGESLLPQCMTYLAEAGLVDNLHEKADALGFQFKNGAAFEKSGEHTFFDFTDKFTEGPGTTYQVKRADFDKLLADGAAKQGVIIRYQHTVLEVTEHAEFMRLMVIDDSGETYTIEAKFVLDASGFGRVLPRLLDLEKPSKFPVRSSYFTHVEDNIDDANFDRNKILITVHPKHPDVWYWLIPFSDGTASVGVVIEPSKVISPEREHDAILFDYINQVPNLSRLLKNAKAIAPARQIKGYSADVTRLHGERFALLGNAGEFLDPVFSSGVTIALRSACLIAPVVNDLLEGKEVDLENDYAKPLKQGVDCFKTFVTAWYDGRFQDVIFHKEQDPQIRQMVCSILAGYAWDTSNPYVAQSERRLDVLAKLCKEYQ